MSLKALSKAIMQGNRQGNQKETVSFHAGNQRETEAKESKNPSALIEETLAEIDGTKDWTGWRELLAKETQQRLREVEAEIDDRCLAMDRPGMLAALSRYRELCIKS